MNINCTKQHIAKISVIALDRHSQEITLLLLQTHTAYIFGSTITGHGSDYKGSIMMMKIMVVMMTMMMKIMVMMMMMMIIIIIMYKYIRVNAGASDMGTINSSDRIAATLYCLWTLFVS
jgi:hypothetical protein